MTQTEVGEMKQRILVVDGDPGSRRLVEMLLTGHDVDVIGAATDEEAYRRVLELGPDLLLVEVLVPRHGGLEFLRKIRTVRGGQDVPALVMSALCRDADVRKEAVGELGALDFMKKPLSRDLLRGRLQSVLGEQEAESAPGEPLPFQGAEIYDRGSLTDVQSPVLFHGLAQNQTTGCLYLRHGASKKVVYFHDGSITFALSNQVRDTLGQHLAGRGKIDEETIKAALQAMRSEGKKMGEYLVQAGLLGLSEMHEAVRQNVLEKVLDVFTWQGGDFRLSSYKNPPGVKLFPYHRCCGKG
jgi:DNA-binding response OmpR family regulator